MASDNAMNISVTEQHTSKQRCPRSRLMATSGTVNPNTCEAGEREREAQRIRAPKKDLKSSLPDPADVRTSSSSHSGSPPAWFSPRVSTEPSRTRWWRRPTRPSRLRPSRRALGSWATAAASRLQRGRRRKKEKKNNSSKAHLLIGAAPCVFQRVSNSLGLVRGHVQAPLLTNQAARASVQLTSVPPSDRPALRPCPCSRSPSAPGRCPPHPPVSPLPGADQSGRGS